jgi:glycosyltransferase involved in cell wall biosynthesis
MTGTLPLVSIVTPSFNQAAYLEVAIQSVLAQSYPNLEYMVIDGGSTDGSLAIIQKYRDRLAWWVSEADSGQAEAINKGLARAQGTIVAWLNSDDLYLPGGLEQAARIFEDNPRLGLIFGDALSIDADGKPFNLQRFGDWGLTELMQFRIICQPTVFIRREALDEAGLLDPSYHYLLDHQLWLRIAARREIAYLPRLVAAARYHAAAKNVAHAHRFGQETFRILAWMETDARFSAQVADQRHQVKAGAECFNAHYLLEGGAATQALLTYARAFASSPRVVLAHKRRIAYVILRLLGGQKLAQGYFQRRSARLPDFSKDPQLSGWPGLNTNPARAALKS